jgi:2-dehydro-3-deoxyphosphogluconate aldolase/(4S)-4-hydroxy-2-oxoglutarate aldolase
VAWSSHAGWKSFVREIQGCCPRFHLGVASVVGREALQDLQCLIFPMRWPPVGTLRW